MFGNSPSRPCRAWLPYVGALLVVGLLFVGLPFSQIALGFIGRAVDLRAADGHRAWKQAANPAVPDFVSTPLGSNQKYTAAGAKNVGRSVAFSADGATMVVGAYDQDGSDGRAYVYQFNGTIWEQKASLTPNAHTTPKGVWLYR